VRKRPITVLIVACVYIAVGAIGFVFHFHLAELLAFQRDSLLIELTELLAIISGVFLLLGRNWARWLAVAWMGFHVAISFPVVRQIVVHSLLLVLIVWLLFRPAAGRYFRRENVKMP
jgi:Trk-type K+ transport system membrane component